MDFESKNNAREALNNLKMEISSELGYHYNMRTDKIEGFAPQETLDGQAQNIKASVEVGGMTSRKLVEMGEKALVDKYNNTIE
ncbi:MAG TPA: alpha/beta-type small acid-soluble spore protein [Romboutsia timonensis]|uniref:Alpha/beta-type small acid-soluble spore protein n=1 Tax=Romboutsia timonensis TaxID=1776391 RepID=A0A921MYC8_9FIRM|nr:alpha/beta-type small acid-soluble spore protein [Romboutsia timonensis]